jgi:hypothetical protein
MTRRHYLSLIVLCASCSPSSSYTPAGLQCKPYTLPPPRFKFEPQPNTTLAALYCRTDSNWDGLEVCRPVAGLLPASEAEVKYAVRSAAKAGEQLKVVGAGHSFSGIQLTDGNLTNPGGRVMSLDLLSGITDVLFLDDGSGDAEVTALAGTRLRDLNSALEARGLAFENLGACAAQSLAGAVATATHGTGRELGSISTQLRGLRVVDAAGTARDLRGDDPATADAFAAAQVGLGAMGVVVAATVRAVPLFKMRKTTFTLPLDELLARHDEFYQNYSRFQWSWVPYSGTATVMLREVTDDAITGCWDEEEEDEKQQQQQQQAKVASSSSSSSSYNNDTTECVDVSYKTLVDSNSAYPERTLYTEMEMFVPVEDAVAAVKDFLAYQDGARATFEAMMAAAGDTTTALYSQVRYVAADDVPLSPMRGRDVAVLSMIVQGDEDATGSADAFELFCKEGVSE